jgi:NAD(P)-dependent dehydrogenase (short-subunit alcohol dehydrogenase family)
MKTADLFRLDGKVALVTGGGRGIGKFIATGLAEAGASLVIASRKMKNLEAAAEEIRKACGVEVLSVACDVAK